MMRLTNLVLVTLAVGLLAAGAYVIGSRVKDDADDRLTPTLSADEASAVADSQLRSALFAANSYFVDNSTYVGMTDDDLRSFLVDQGWGADGAHRELDLRGDGSVLAKQVRLHTSLA